MACELIILVQLIFFNDFRLSIWTRIANLPKAMDENCQNKENRDQHEKLNKLRGTKRKLGKK